MVLEQAKAEFNYCLRRGRCFNLETEIKERRKVRYELKDQTVQFYQCSLCYDTWMQGLFFITANLLTLTNIGYTFGKS